MRPAQSTPSIRIGPYELHERLGEGGSGQVYRATGPDGAVAVKILGPGGELDAASGARFRREIAALQQLAHGNLVRLLDHGVDAELGPYLVLPVLAGMHLRAAIAGATAGGPAGMCPEAAILLARPIAAALGALHAAGYIHRDVKPENVIAGPDGAITLIDLGLAWRDGMTQHTESGAAVGSVGYMAPEQIDGRGVAASADVFAIGVMIYEWICGRRPFARGRPAEEAAATLIGTATPLGAADRRADDELADLVGRCLAMDPAKRPAADELAAALGAMIDWCGTSDAELATARAEALAGAAAYQAKVAPFRVRRTERRAREALEAGQPFVALARCDRGLAYAPDHPALTALVGEAERASGGRPVVVAPIGGASGGRPVVVAPIGGASGGRPGVVAPVGDASGGRPGVVAPVGDASGGRPGVVAPVGDASGGRPGVVAPVGGAASDDVRHVSGEAPVSGEVPICAAAAVTSAPIARAPRARKRLILAGAGAAIAVAVAVALIVHGRGGDAKAVPQPAAGAGPMAAPPSADPWNGSGATPPTPAEISDDHDKVATMGAMIGLLGHAMNKVDQLEDGKVRDKCVALAERGAPEAVDTCDGYVGRHPTDPLALAARAIALLRQNKAALAIADIDRAITVRDDPRWRRIRAAAEASSGNAAAAKADLAKACEMGDVQACEQARGQ